MFLSFIITSIIIELTPGPNMAYLAILSATAGRRAGFSAVLGIAIGLFAIGIAGAFGVAALISSSALIYQVLRWCGVFYLLWLAWDGWNTAKETAPDKANVVSHNAKFFKRGLITNLLNPKAVVFYVAVLPSFVDNASPVLPQTIILTMIYVAVATTIHIFIVALAGETRKLFAKPKQILIVRRILSLLLGVVAIWFAMTTGKAIP